MPLYQRRERDFGGLRATRKVMIQEFSVAEPGERALVEEMVEMSMKSPRSAG